MAPTMDSICRNSTAAAMATYAACFRRSEYISTATTALTAMYAATTPLGEAGHGTHAPVLENKLRCETPGMHWEHCMARMIKAGTTTTRGHTSKRRLAQFFLLDTPVNAEVNNKQDVVIPGRQRSLLRRCCWLDTPRAVRIRRTHDWCRFQTTLDPTRRHGTAA